MVKRLPLTSLLVGCLISCSFTALMWVTHLGYWLPGTQPGWLFAWTVIIVSRGGPWASRFGIALVTIGNAAFYAWLFFRVMKVEIASQGRLGRYFVQ